MVDDVAHARHGVGDQLGDVAGGRIAHRALERDAAVLYADAHRARIERSVLAETTPNVRGDLAVLAQRAVRDPRARRRVDVVALLVPGMLLRHDVPRGWGRRKPRADDSHDSPAAMASSTACGRSACR